MSPKGKPQNDSTGFIDAHLDDENIKAWDGEVSVPAAGDYKVRIREGIEEQTSKAGNPMIVTTFEIVSMADGSPTDEAGKTVRGWYVTNTQQGKNRLKNLINAAQVKLDGGGFHLSSLEGAELCLTVKNEPYTNTNTETGVEEERMGAKAFRERPVSSDEPGDAEPPPPPVSTRGNGRAQQARR